MSALDRLLALTDIRGSLDLRCQFQGQWAHDHEQEPTLTAAYHIVLAGECNVEFQGEPTLHLQAGDILLLPKGISHRLRSVGAKVETVMPVVESGALLPVHRIQGHAQLSAHALDMLCGKFVYDSQSSLFQALPQHLQVSFGTLAAGHPLRALVGILRSEVEGQGAGARSVVDSLSSALFTLILRAHLEQNPQGDGVLSLMSDKRLASVWQAVTDDLAHGWTIEELAELAAMSRATFMRTFSRVAGDSPWNLLTQVRMERACQLLTTTSTSLIDIAAQTGYQSQAAFSSKFKQVYGQSPGRLRKGTGDNHD